MQPADVVAITILNQPAIQGEDKTIKVNVEDWFDLNTEKTRCNYIWNIFKLEKGGPIRLLFKEIKSNLRIDTFL